MANTQIKVQWGNFLAQALNDESSMMSAVIGSLYNHFAPPLLDLAVPPSVVQNAVMKGMGALSSAVKGQVISFSVPSGIIADVVAQVEAAVPGFIDKAHELIDPDITAALVAIGVLPKPAA